MCTYFHTTNKQIPVGETFSIEMFDGDTTTDHSNRSEPEKEINNLLDSARPEGTLSRKKCIYLFNNLAICKAYARSLGANHIYKVISHEDIFGPYPMTLLTTLKSCNDGNRQPIIEEYWNNTQNWKVNEFLTSSIVIMEEISLGNGGYNIEPFTDDRVLSRKLYGC